MFPAPFAGFSYGNKQEEVNLTRLRHGGSWPSRRIGSPFFTVSTYAMAATRDRSNQAFVSRQRRLSRARAKRRTGPNTHSLAGCCTSVNGNPAGFSGARLVIGILLHPALSRAYLRKSDNPTALLMWRFYSNLKAGQPKAAALHEAKNWLRTLTHDDLKKLGRANPAIADLTRTIGPKVKRPKGPKAKDEPVRPHLHPYAHPHYWAAFILTGDPE